ncbi:MAG: hypothetical protein EHM38_08880 [Geobacteraceae bacterium]|nr:MAG: hypothetical protein EHM38_08880 [Geobacteraceae bacterium]
MAKDGKTYHGARVEPKVLRKEPLPTGAPSGMEPAPFIEVSVALITLSNTSLAFGGPPPGLSR